MLNGSASLKVKNGSSKRSTIENWSIGREKWSSGNKEEKHPGERKEAVKAKRKETRLSKMAQWKCPTMESMYSSSKLDLLTAIIIIIIIHLYSYFQSRKSSLSQHKFLFLFSDKKMFRTKIFIPKSSRMKKMKIMKVKTLFLYFILIK